ncbi:MAG: hypothetical protein QOE11_8 [Solirubrobacteraceae bacterium]|jgi:uncharacterized protein YbcI|nr:hypothetical protein [Solirubrobacteraceae bacterium]
MASTMHDRPTGGSLTAAISNAVVRITAEYTGRGPTKARTSFRDDVILVLLQETLTKAERSLLAAGEGDFVLETRTRFQRTMRNDYVDAVEKLTGRKVIAFMSANHLQPDMGAEMFVLEPVAEAATPLSPQFRVRPEDGPRRPPYSDG